MGQIYSAQAAGKSNWKEETARGFRRKSGFYPPASLNTQFCLGHMNHMDHLKFRIANHPCTRLVFKTPWIGMFPDYRTALEAIPPDADIGYNQKRTQEIFRTYPVDRVRPADYPIMLHLRDLLHPGSRVLDMGGNIGMACYTAQEYFPLPSPLEWKICDVPMVLETAREVAAREKKLMDVFQYVATIEEAGRCDIFFSSGALQFLEQPLTQLLQRLPELPPVVLINRIPVWDRGAFATIHDNGFCVCPYHVFNRRQFVSEMKELGYSIVDDWDCPESSLSIRFRPRTRLNAYHGYYFSRSAVEHRTAK